MLNGRIISLVIVACLFSFSALAAIGDKYAANIINNKGEVIGYVNIIQATQGVLLRVHAGSLTPGAHGMHFHSVGTCEDHDHFKMTKGHINPHDIPHGFLNPDGPHEGNLPNLLVGKDGSVSVELYSPLVELNLHKGSNRPALLDEDGSTLIIHTSEDDHTTQPIGGAGARVACALIRK